MGNPGSKQHGTGGSENYWFAFHPHQRDVLEETGEAYCVLGCGSADKLLVIPFSLFAPLLESTWTTLRADRMYWHVRIEHREGIHRMALRKGSDNFDMQPYLLREANA